MITGSHTHHLLARLVSQVRCKPGWQFRLHEFDNALSLIITVPGQDSYQPENPLRVSHFHPVPTATYNERTWLRWIFEQCRRVENHELGEWFRVAEGEKDGGRVEFRRPFAPMHGPGEDPYLVHDYRDEKDAQTLQDGSRAEEIKT